MLHRGPVRTCGPGMAQRPHRYGRNDATQQRKQGAEGLPLGRQPEGVVFYRQHRAVRRVHRRLRQILGHEQQRVARLVRQG